MAIYSLHSRSPAIVMTVIVTGIGLGVFGLFGRSFFADGESRLSAGSSWFAVVVVTFFCGIWVLGGLSFLRSVREIRAHDDGMIEFVRVMGSTTVDARDIRCLDGAYRRDYDGDLFWRLKIACRGGTFTFNQFLDVMEFVERVRAQNPTVEITGLWPMTSPMYPPDRWLARRDGESTR